MYNLWDACASGPDRRWAYAGSVYSLPFASLASTLEDLGIPGIVGLLGVLLGWGLNQRSAADALVKQQKRDAASALLDALVEVRMSVSVMAPVEDIPGLLAAARDHWRRAALRYLGRIGDEDLTSRVDAIMFVMVLASAGGRPPTENPGMEAPPGHLFNLAYIVDRAFQDPFCALDAYLNGKPLPPRTFPENPIEVAADDSSDGGALDRVRAALDALPDPAPTARTKYITALM